METIIFSDATITIQFLAITIRSLELYRRIKAGQADPTRSNQKTKRFILMTKEVLTHAKMLKFTGSGIAHWFVMLGFFALSGTLLNAYGQVINPEFALPLIGHWIVYNLFTESFAWLTGISIVTLIGIRQVTRITNKGRSSRFYGSASWKAYYVEGT
ncbi:MAG: Fe-S oxidoreductase, partial [Actinobacteria bacterium]|nr:Fe-S oxidoreductase [Actinomycetota bacterium]